MTKKEVKTVKINFDLKLINDIYIKEKMLEEKSRYLILYGGAGSGKSVFIGQKILIRLLTERNHRILVTRKVARTLRNSVFALFKDLIAQWNLTKFFTINKTEMTITCLNGNQILFVGLDDVEKLKSIAGVTSIWIEEASELLKTDFDQLDLRLRGTTINYKQIIISFNPISNQSWLKKEFFDRTSENTRILKTTYLDNRFIDDDYKAALERLKETNPDWYLIYALGEFGSTGNLIFTNWEIKDIPKDAEEYSVPIYSGLDFGFNDPSAMVRIAVKENNIYLFDELYEKELTNTELIEEVKRKMSKKDLLICDSAEPDRIKEFKKAGFNKAKGANKGQGSIKSGIDKIKQHKIYVSPQCVNVIRELQNYQYMKDKKTDEYIDIPLANGYDHLLDALRYAMEAVASKKQLKAGLSLY